MSLQMYADQMKSIDPSVKVVGDVMKFKYHNHAVTVSKLNDDQLSITLKAPAHMKYSVNSDVVKDDTVLSPTDLKKALTPGEHPAYRKTLEVQVDDSKETVELNHLLEKWVGKAKLVRQVTFHGIQGVAGVDDQYQVYFDGGFATRGRSLPKKVYIDDQMAKVTYSHRVPDDLVTPLSAGRTIYPITHQVLGDITYQEGQIHLTVDLTQLTKSQKQALFDQLRPVVEENDNYLANTLYQAVGVSLPEVTRIQHHDEGMTYHGQLDESIDFQIHVGRKVQPLEMTISSQKSNLRFRDTEIRQTKDESWQIKEKGPLRPEARIRFPGLSDIGQLASIWLEARLQIRDLKTEVTNLQSLSEQSDLAKAMSLNLDDLQLMSGLTR